MFESQGSRRNAPLLDQPNQIGGLVHWRWWLLVTLNIFFILAGQSIATLLGKFYYDKGGKSKGMAALVQTAAFPILYIPLFFFNPTKEPSLATNSSVTKPSFAAISLIYFLLGLLLAGENMFYSIGLLYLPVSTYSLICATQLAFNAVISYFLNSQKVTVSVLNSVVILTLSASLLAVGSEAADPTGVSKAKYALGFLCTLAASACYSLMLSLMQLTFQKVMKSETFSVVLDMQIYTSLVATCACVVGLFVSGEWRGLEQEMNGFEKGRVSYVMTLVCCAIAWQICSVGVVGLIFLVSSLFSNAISTFALPVVPVFAMIFFHDKMDGVKVVALSMAVWGFVSYLYQSYLDDSKQRDESTTDVIKDPETCQC